MFSKTAFVSILFICSFTGAAAVPGHLDKRSEGFLQIDFNIVKASEDVVGFPLQRRDESYPITVQNKQLYYIADLYFGSDKQKVGVEIDTGSSDLWVIDSEADIEGTYGVFDHSTSSSFEETSISFEISYLDQSSALGKYSTDDVSLSPNGPTVKDLRFGDVTSVRNISYGVFGIGFEDDESAYPTYDNFPVTLKKQGLIEKPAYSIYLNDHHSSSGTVLFGGIDHAKYTGELHTYPIEPLDSSSTTLYPFIWANSKSISFNGTHVPGPKFIFDTGSSVNALERGRLVEVAELVGANNYDEKGYFYYWDSVDDVPDGFSIEFEGLTVPIPKSDLYIEEKASTGETVPAFTFFPDLGYNILGDSFLKHVYAVIDLEDKTIQLANVQYTDESNITVIS